MHVLTIWGKKLGGGGTGPPGPPHAKTLISPCYWHIVAHGAAKVSFQSAHAQCFERLFCRKSDVPGITARIWTSLEKWKWNNQHVTSLGQRKNPSPRQDSNLWPPKHWVGALSTWTTENSWKARPYARFIFDTRPTYWEVTGSNPVVLFHLPGDLHLHLNGPLEVF